MELRTEAGQQLLPAVPPNPAQQEFPVGKWTGVTAWLSWEEAGVSEEWPS